MGQKENNQKVVIIAGLALVVIASIGGYLYNSQQDRIRSFEEQGQSKQQQIDELAGQVQKLENERSALRDSLASEQASNQQMQAQLDATIEEREQADEAMKKELENLAAASSELEKDLSRQKEEQKSLDSRLDTVSGEKDQLENRLASERERRRQLQQQIDEVSADVNRKESALADAEQSLSELNTELAQNKGEQEQLKKQLDEINRQRELDSEHFAQLEKQLKKQLDESRFEISQLKNRMTVIKLTSEVLFTSGSATIKPAGKDVLTLIADTLNNYPDRAIHVEGHTDSIPVGDKSRYSSNWELSAARALAAVEHLQQTNSIDPGRMQIVGYGEFHPVASNDTAAGRQLNRRIEIKLLPAS